ncbi:hypothetical protein ANCDUO_16661, partial [Ancylostoma duodenale]
QVDVVESHENVLFSTEETPGSIPDPRFPSLGRRLYSTDTGQESLPEYHERRMKYGISEGCEELGTLLPFQIISCGHAYGLALLSLSAFGQPLSVAGSPIKPYKPSWMPDSALKPNEKKS